MTDEAKLEKLLSTIEPSIYESLNRTDHDLLRQQAQEKIIGVHNFLPAAKSQFYVIYQKLYGKKQPEKSGQTNFYSIGSVLPEVLKK